MSKQAKDERRVYRDITTPPQPRWPVGWYRTFDGTILCHGCKQQVGETRGMNGSGLVERSCECAVQITEVRRGES